MIKLQGLSREEKPHAIVISNETDRNAVFNMQQLAALFSQNFRVFFLFVI